MQDFSFTAQLFLTELHQRKQRDVQYYDTLKEAIAAAYDELVQLQTITMNCGYHGKNTMQVFGRDWDDSGKPIDKVVATVSLF